MADTVNAQVLDAIANTNVKVMGESPAESQSLVFESMAHSLSLIMHNAGSTQYGMQQVETAMVASVCAAIVDAGKK